MSKLTPATQDRINQEAEMAADKHFQVTRIPGGGLRGQDAFEADSLSALERNGNFRPTYLAARKAGAEHEAEKAEELAQALENLVEMLELVDELRRPGRSEDVRSAKKALKNFREAK